MAVKHLFSFLHAKHFLQLSFRHVLAPVTVTGHGVTAMIHRRSQRGNLGDLGPLQREWKNLHNHFSCAKVTNIYVKVLCLVIVNVNMTKYMLQKCQI